ncbi:bifunctional UDP-N-acetylglucosamine diphosphorylase/glucosamine-1-phosphate N-acetyltransferase GlmU [Desulfovibrio sp. OttesenSCG-928-C06]|nr:bifunctional UDP-N-acetylglucosamine diphosphorylase/glucosamine-1-phosphate N-acetyltransferase GlmU [Desulfovibrio sp. OttesenSCG-928-C06]
MRINTNNIGALILAAGKGTRMSSPLPKVLHTLLGENMINLVVSALKPLFPKNIRIVVGHQAEAVQKAVTDQTCRFVLQEQQLGTGHALMTAWPELKAAGMQYVLVVNGDTPLIKTSRVEAFIRQSLDLKADVAFMSMTLDDPASFGRVLRKDGKVLAILEAKDYDPMRHGPEPKEINAGIYLLRLESIAPLLEKITCTNKSKEYYITDLVYLAAQSGLTVAALEQGDEQSLLGINTPAELVRSEELLRVNIVEGWLERGVLIRNPGQARIAPGVTLEPGCELYGPCELYGKSSVASGAHIESHVWANDTAFENGCKVRSFCHFESAVIGAGASVGPFARLRPGAVLEEEAHVGNFVEMKKSRLGKGAKAGHLAYLGDTQIGAGANIGAGTITCNYDGKNKHATQIGAGAFIGSNSSLVAPVNIGDNALVGAGSTITKDVPANEMGIARGRQKNLPRRSMPE